MNLVWWLGHSEILGVLAVAHIAFVIEVGPPHSMKIYGGRFVENWLILRIVGRIEEVFFIWKLWANLIWNLCILKHAKLKAADGGVDTFEAKWTVWHQFKIYLIWQLSLLALLLSHALVHDIYIELIEIGLVEDHDIAQEYRVHNFAYGVKWFC